MRLADGRRFVRKRRWHRYNGALVEHSVEKFKGERLTVVLYNQPTPGDSCKEVRESHGGVASSLPSTPGTDYGGGAAPSLFHTGRGDVTGESSASAPSLQPGAASEAESTEVPLGEGRCDCCEPVMAVKKNYRNVGKREKQEALFPELQKEIAAKRVELYKGVRWPDEAARRSAEYQEAMKDAVKDKIGGTPDEQRAFFARVIANHSTQF